MDQQEDQSSGSKNSTPSEQKPSAILPIQLYRLMHEKARQLRDTGISARVSGKTPRWFVVIKGTAAAKTRKNLFRFPLLRISSYRTATAPIRVIHRAHPILP